MSAFNFSDIGYTHNIPKDLEGSTLRVRGVVGTQLKNDYESKERTLLLPTNEEKGVKGELCIWVGMLPKGAIDHTASALKNETYAPKKGKSIASQTSRILPYDNFAMKVVSVVAHDMNKYYALMIAHFS